MSQLYEAISAACIEASAISLRARLLPASGLADDARFFLLPPTYAELGHLLSPVREDGTHAYVLIDSPQSWANRLEEVADDPAIGLPRVTVRVGNHALTLHRLPHRIYDAILRDAEIDGQPFRASPAGSALVAARPDHAAALLHQTPTVLLFGGWDSFSGQGVAGAKFPAALSGQIIGFDALPAKKAGVRTDPLGIDLESFRAWKAARPGQMWTDDEAEAEHDEKGKPVVAKPSEVGHGNILVSDKSKGTPYLEKGAWVSGIELRSALSLTRLRRYRFPLDGRADPAADHAGRVLLAALAVLLQTERLARGLDLRAGCELDAVDARWTLRTPLKADQVLEGVTPEAARAAWQAARAAAVAHGLGFAADLEYVASARLENLVARHGA